MPDQFETSGQCELPDDVTPEELAGALFGRPIRRGNVNYRVSLNITDEDINEILAEAGIELSDENDIYGDDE